MSLLPQTDLPQITLMNADNFDPSESAPIRAISGQTSSGRLLHEDLTRSIIGCAMTVLNTLKPGLDEKLYENALVLELRAHGHHVEQQKCFPVFYREVEIGKGFPDLIVDSLVIVDPKIAEAFTETHSAQMIGYLNLSGLDLALLLNFKHAKLTWKRMVNEENNRRSF